MPGEPTLDANTQERFVEPSGEAFRALVEVMAKLRSPDGCPWDREQTHSSLARHLLEETYETLEAIEDGDLVALREELGDLVLQVIFHSEIAFEEGAFGVADVVDDLRKKLIHRHPHVFGDKDLKTADDVYANWERQKREDKGTRVMDGIPKEMPALARAAKMHRRALQAGFLWRGVDGFFDKLDEELSELKAEIDNPERDVGRVEAEMGDVLFMMVTLAQHLDLEPETALRRMLDRFSSRFEVMESLAASDGSALESLSAEQWRGYWDEAKEAHP